MAAPQLKKPQQPQNINDLLRRCVLFHEANDEVLNFIAQNCETVSFAKGACIILENEANDAVYFVLRGSVEILSYLATDKRVQRLALLEEGSHFAEFSVLTNTARSGSAYAYEDCELLKINGANFYKALNHFPDVAAALVLRLAQLNQQAQNVTDIVPYWKHEDLHLSPQLTEILPIQNWEKFQAIPVSLKANLLTVLVKDPHNEPLWNFLRTGFGALQVSVHLVKEHEFDEIHARALASLKRTDVPVSVTGVDVEFSEPIECMRASDLFHGLSDPTLTQILPHVQTVSVKAGTNIISAKKYVDSCLLVMKGQVLMSRPITGEIATAPVLTLGPGECIGETQLSLGAPSECIYRAIEDTTFLVFSKPLWDQLLAHAPFLVRLAQVLATRLQRLGHITGLKYYRGPEVIDFTPVARILPLSVVGEEQVLPLKIEDREVTLGIVNSDASLMFTKVGRYLLDYRIKLVGITQQQFDSWYRLFKKAHEVSNDGPRVVGLDSSGNFDVLKWVDAVLLHGFQNRASDIHFEPNADGLATRFRIDGVMHEFGERLAKEAAAHVTNRLKILASMDIGLQHLPQDGRIAHELGNTTLTARASTLPVKHGEKVVLRIIRNRSGVVPVEMIAPDRRLINILQAVANSHQGLFLVTGPTGSGKTTTLYSLLRAINQVGVNVISLEDPVEMEIPGINQVEIQRKRGLDFAISLRSVLRQDPDVIMVGEIRDEETAKIVFEAAITGHLVLSTLHSSSSFDVVPRLKELGVPSATLAEGLLGVLTQRLVRTICKHCVEDRAITDAEKQVLQRSLKLTSLPQTLKHGRGCRSCNHTGYHDRIPVLEAWRSNHELRDRIRKDASSTEMQALAREDGFETIYEFALKMVLSGLTTISEVDRVLSGH